METPRSAAMMLSSPMGANSVTPMPKAPAARASSGRLSFMEGYPVGARSDGRRVQQGEAVLGAVRVVGIGDRAGAGGVEPGDLVGRQGPADGAEIVAQLRLVAGPDDHRRHGRPPQQPVEGDLRHG